MFGIPVGLRVELKENSSISKTTSEIVENWIDQRIEEDQ
jgi:hypothetical protein